MLGAALLAPRIVAAQAAGPVAPAPAPAGDSPPPSDESKPGDAAPAPAVPPAERVPANSEANRPPPEPVAPSTGFSWQPFGFIRLQYIAIQADPNVGYIGRDDGFELQNARVGARGKLGNIAAFVLSFDGAVDQRTQINSPQGNIAVGLRDAYVDARIAGDVTGRGGYFQALVDPEAQIPDTSREFVDKPIETRGVLPTQGYQTPGLPPGRSIGAAIRLDPEVPTTGAKFGFEVAAQNGADEFSSNNDNNSLALSATALLRLPHDSWLVASGRYNPRTIGALPFRQDETDYQGAFGAHLGLGPVSLGGGIVIEHTTFDTTGGPAQDAYGAHVQAMVRIPASLPVAIGYRFGILDPSSLITTDRVIEHTVGAVLGVPRLRMRFQLQLTHVDEQAGRELENDRAQLAAEVSL